MSDAMAIVHGRGGVEMARARAASYAEQADAELEGLPPSPARDALVDCLTYAVERRS